ncbi:nucleoside diphosphate kinase 7 [Venturia canescens]|uniref:nucleoside diphosphate kinase 7 n=1 Tax=Venturia canescens TaxID=32260 RepID=UPI001C9D032F|nr:nucleoside diphosphate kinase 7 [Venturia canescens]XP_043287453.1 nucleoside diphosphate kinase 7 [Venturia canescens]
MSGNLTERLIFEAEWFDKVSSMLKKFYLYYFPADNTIELYDIKTKKTFLRRTKCEGIEARNLYVGSMVTIFSRAMKITDVADTITRNKIASRTQKTFAMIKPDAMEKMGEILKFITNHDFHINNIEMVKLSEDDVEFLYSNRADQELRELKKHLTSARLLVLELLGENGTERFRQLIGPTDSKVARSEAPASLRACYGEDSIKNTVHGSATQEQADQELDYFFPEPKSKRKGLDDTATLKYCTCCVIKPHAVQARLAGQIIDSIQKSGFRITAIQQFVVEPVNAEEFLEVYKGVLPEYSAMVAELQSGPCIAMEITHVNEELDVPTEFRKICGPMDPDIARQVRPETLRAKYGKTKVQNAVHCSDLPEDGLLEVEYFFKILSER